MPGECQIERNVSKAASFLQAGFVCSAWGFHVNPHPASLHNLDLGHSGFPFVLLQS